MTVQPAPSGSVPDFDRLVDPRFGVVLGLHPKQLEADEPAALKSFHGSVGNSRMLGQWYGDRISLGTSFNNPAAARRAAIGEAVERYCGNFVPDTLRKASFNQWQKRGEQAIDPQTLLLYSERQYAAKGFPFVPFTRDLEVYWARGRELSTGEPTWVPASLVYPNYFVDALVFEPRTNFVNLSGIATGGGREDAERSALEEVIERDAVTVWWISGSPPNLLDLDSDVRLPAALMPAHRDDPLPLSYQLFSVPNVFDVPVLGALLRDPKNQIVTIGVATRPDPVAGALKSLAEAVHLRGYSRELLTEGGRIWEMMEEGVLDRRVYKPYRRDRRYLDDYRTDFHDVVDLGCHAQIYLDPRMHRHLERFDESLKADPVGRPLSSVAEIPEADRGDLRGLYLRRLAAEGISAYSVDVTTPDVASVGLSVVRVIAPGLYGNAPAAFPHLAGRRLYEDPVRLGLLPEVPTEDELVAAPIPHT